MKDGKPLIKIRLLQTSTWVKGAALLGAAAVISKLIGVLQKVPLQNIAGDAAFGIYSTVYPFYILVLFLSTAGFPVAVSKFVAEKAAVGDQAGMRKIIVVSMWLLTMTGFVGFVLLFFGADVIASWIGNVQTAASIRSVSCALLIVPVMSVLRGYFQGQQNMLPTAVSQVAEQCIRVATMLALLLIFTSHGMGDDVVAAGATFGSVGGAVAGLLVMMWYWRNRQVKQLDPGKASGSVDQPVFADESYRVWSKRLLAFAIPVCLGSVVVPVLSIVDTFTVPRLLALRGWSDWQAMEQMGVLSRGLTLTQLASMLFSSVSVAVIPLIAKAKKEGQPVAVRLHADRILHLTWLIGLAASLGAVIAAAPINQMLFTDRTGTDVMALIAVSIVFSVVNIMSAALLQGMGIVVQPAVHLLIAAIAKVGLNVWLVPQYGILGAAAAAVIAFAAAALLNVWTLRRHLGLRLPPGAYLRQPIVILAVMSAVLLILRRVCPLLPEVMQWSERVGATLTACMMVAAGCATFALLVWRMNKEALLALAVARSLGQKYFSK